MAALDDDIPSSPLSRFNRAVPLRQSKLVTGPFRATKIWNEVIEHLKEKVELKRRRYKLRNYDDSFTGTDAVDVVLHYLLSDQDTFCNLSREKAVKLCQSLMDKKVFKPVGCKSGEDVRHTFEDSSGKIYHFIGVLSNKENVSPDSEDEIDGRDDLCEDINDSLISTQTCSRLQGSSEVDQYDGDSRLLGGQRSGSEESLDCKKRKNLNTSQRSSKRQKMCASSSTESLNEESLSEYQIQDIWKEVALCQLLRIIDLSFLDGVLMEEKEKTSKKQFKPHGTPVSNIVAKHWSMRCSAKSATHSDPYMKAALEVIAHLPRGVSKFDTDFTKTSDPVTKLQAYNMICEHYSGKLDCLFPERFVDLNVAILQLVLSGRDDEAMQAMQLNMILLPARQKAELQRLLKFMAASIQDQELKLDPQSDNEILVLTHLTDSILKHKGLSWDLSSTLVQFIVKSSNSIFDVPASLREKVSARLQETRNGSVPIIEETVFCSQVPISEYQKQADECTNKSLVQMMNTIIDNPKMVLKEKKNKLRQFRKYHPHIYAKHFSGMV
ncbi:DEPD7-like protein [Mya arenaria]|uniref:DEPD7-like protein n=1 Tax=Mya arenaria TaxID=6604 RepID=A0ABY7EM12_MYAAR|nr:DEP domain-containing protein 7-like [Mya arenaria]WAR09424.1 DEPD7-like protein [Mya arenaria]